MGTEIKRVRIKTKDKARQVENVNDSWKKIKMDLTTTTDKYGIRMTQKNKPGLPVE